MDVSRANGHPISPNGRGDDRIQRLKRLSRDIADARDRTPFFRCQLSRIMLRCKAIMQVVLSQRRPEVECHEVERFLEKVRGHCYGWTGLDLVWILVRVPTELAALENEVNDLCVKCSLVQEPSQKEIESDEERDWTELVDRYKDHFSDDFKTECKELSETDATAMMEALQKVFTTTTDVIRMRKEPCRNLIFRIINSLWKRLDIVSVPVVDVQEVGENVGYGGYGDISKARYKGKLVAVKSPRDLHLIQEESSIRKAKKALRREVLFWYHLTRLRHENIFPLIGVTSLQFPMKMVSPYCIHKDLRKFIEKSENMSINRLRLVASGLKALHEHVPLVIHGDLKCANVLVKADGTACLADFGLAAVRNNGATLTSTSQTYGTLRWTAVELLPGSTQEEESQTVTRGLKMTVKSDIWSFGMLALELLTGKDPFSNLGHGAVIMALFNKERPLSPDPETVQRGLKDQLWWYLWNCWDSSPDKRPALNSLISVLNKLAHEWSPSRPVPQQHAKVYSRFLRMSGRVPDIVIQDRIEVPSDIRGYIIGTLGWNIKAYQRDYDVLINQDGGGEYFEITGKPENVEAAKIRIQSDVDKRSNHVNISIDIPNDLHRWLIGANGQSIRSFEAKHHVQVEFDKDKATIMGCSQRVEEAKTDLLEMVKQIVDRQQRPSREVTVSSHAVIHWLGIQRATLKQLTGICDILIPNDDSNVVILKGPVYALDRAEDAIREVEHSGDSKRVVAIPVDLRGLVVGGKWSKWTEMVVRCGGPKDPLQQRLMIDIPEKNSTQEQVTLRGNSKVIDDLVKEIQQIVTMGVYGMRISIRYHRKLQSQLRSLAESTGTKILLPGSGPHSQFHWQDLVNAEELRAYDMNTIVQIVGPFDGFCRVRSELKERISHLRQRIITIEVPLKLEKAIYEQVKKALRVMSVTISSQVDARTQFSPVRSRPPEGEPEEFSWNPMRRYDSNDTREGEWSRWTLEADSKENVEEACNLINKACAKAKEQNWVGFLTFQDCSKFGRIIGTGGETCERIQKETRTIIQVPRKDSPPDLTTVVIIGSENDIEEAKNAIIKLTTVRTRSNDGLFRPRAPSLRTTSS